jgi:hypothetical protein
LAISLRGVSVSLHEPGRRDVLSIVDLARATELSAIGTKRRTLQRGALLGQFARVLGERRDHQPNRRHLEKKWGWQVIERDGFTKPNRFGYAPDGYVLQIEARPDPKYPPSLVGSSPCFPGNLPKDDVPRSPVIQQNQQR